MHSVPASVCWHSRWKGTNPAPDFPTNQPTLLFLYIVVGHSLWFLLAMSCNSCWRYHIPMADVQPWWWTTTNQTIPKAHHSQLPTAPGQRLSVRLSRRCRLGSVSMHQICVLVYPLAVGKQPFGVTGIQEIPGVATKWCVCVCLRACKTCVLPPPKVEFM